MTVEMARISEGIIEPRTYQTTIASSCLEGSTLVVLPTGLGKTALALLVISSRLDQERESRVLMMAPTRPLVEQHHDFLAAALPKANVVAFTGGSSPADRRFRWETADVVVSTPQVVQNDVTAGRYSLEEVTLVVFDEAHRARGNYSYVYVAERYMEQRSATGRQGLCLGTTASPGNDPKQVLEVCRNLGLERVEIRSEDDVDVRPYVHEIVTRWRVVGVPPGTRGVVRPLEKIKTGLIRELQRKGMLRRGPKVSVTDLLKARERIQEAISARKKDGSTVGDDLSDLIRLSMSQAKAMTLDHAIELAETQGPGPLRAFLKRIHERPSASTGELLAEPLMQEAIEAAEEIEGHHPKIDLLKEVLEEQFERDPGSRVIVFSHYRDTAELIIEELSTTEAVCPSRFVGQASRTRNKGMTQAEQSRVLDSFRDGSTNVLVATSVAEEGLDIPATDMVVFFEPVSSEIRSIQRRGRTGRARTGRVEILITKGTKDEVVFWASKKREGRRRSRLENLREELSKALDVGRPGPDPSVLERSRIGLAKHPSANQTQSALTGFQDGTGPVAGPDDRDTMIVPMAKSIPLKEGPKVTIIVDHRELGSQVSLELGRMNVDLEPRQLEVGDYLLSDRVGIERKTGRDLADSILDGRLFDQLGALRSSFSRPILMIEGKDMDGGRNISTQALEGALTSILVDFGVPVIRTKDARGTATLLLQIAQRERKERPPTPSRHKRPGPDIQSRMHHLVEGLPNISATFSRRLLAHFGSIRAIMNATIEQLMEVKGVGKARAVSIYDLVNHEYQEH